MRRWLVALSLLVSMLTPLGKAAPLFATAGPVTARAATELTPAAVPLAAGGGKLMLAFTGRTDGRLTVEADERVRLLDLRNLASRVRLEFYDAKGAVVPGAGVDVPLLAQAVRDYVRVLHSPPPATACRLFLRPAAGAEAVVEQLSLGADLPASERATLNPHPTFDAGDLNTYGCLTGNGGGFFTRPDGRTVWNTGFLGYGPAFPVVAGQSYTFLCRGKPYQGRKSYLLVDCFNATDRAPLKSMRVEFSATGASTTLLIPPAAVSAQLRCYCVILEEIRVTAAAPPEATHD